MPIHYVYDAADLVRVKSVGVVSADDIRRYYEGRANEPFYDVDDALWWLSASE